MAIISIIILLIATAISALVIWPLAKFVGKIAHANFRNSYVVCLIASILYAAIIYMIGKHIFGAGLALAMTLNILIVSLCYISAGKMVWKCSWVESLKANIIWIVVYSAFLVYIYNKFPMLKQLVDSL